MKTDVVFAYVIENNDFLLDNDGCLLGYIYSINDDGDFIELDIVDEDAVHTFISVGPFDPITIVTSFDEEYEFEDVDY